MRFSKEQVLKELVHELRIYIAANKSMFNADLNFAIFGIDNSTLQKKYTINEEAKLYEKYFSDKWQWDILSKSYEYGFYGVLPNGVNADDIENGIPLKTIMEMLELIGNKGTNQSKIVCYLYDILDAGLGRQRLDQGTNLTIINIALLANVDERTVRNAISAKELEATKLDNEISIDNKSAINWLSSRKGFNSTKFPNLETTNFDDIKSIPEFGAYLKKIRENLGIDISNQRWISEEKGIRKEHILGIEQGIFILSIDKCEVLSDFYNIDRSSFLLKVMGLFFKEELELIKNSLNQRGELK